MGDPLQCETASFHNKTYGNWLLK